MSSLQEKAAAGIKWTSMSALITTSLQFLKLPIIARLLQPEDFGLMAMVTVVMGFAQAYADMGISNAIIYRQDVTRNQLSSLYWLNIFAGVIVFALIITSSPLIVRFYQEPRLSSLIFWAALNFLITPVGQQFRILLQKELKFNQLAKVEVTAATSSFLVAIVTAWLGQGVFALIWGQLTNTICSSALLARLGWTTWRPKLHFKRADIKSYVGFGLYQMGERSINYFSANVDYIVIGKFLAPETLGVYTLAYQLVTMPLTKLNPILTRVAFPLFAKKRMDNAALRRGYLGVSKLLALIIFPLLVGLAVSSPLVIPIVFGSQWESAIPIIQILALVGILKTLGNPSGSIILAKGRADLGFKWNILVATINLLIFVLIAPYGMYAIAWSYTVLSFIYFILGYKILINHTIQLSFRNYISVLLTPFFITFLASISLYLSSVIVVEFVEYQIVIWTGLALMITIYLTMYLMLYRVFDIEYFQYLYKFVYKGKQGE